MRSFYEFAFFFVAVIAICFAQTVQAQKGGTVAYIRDSTEIRLIDPDGANDRRLWTHPDAKKALGIDYLAWRPDGKELAFSSKHAAAASLYDADLYVVRPDGSGFRKLTNAPDRAEFTRFPKGNVSVTLRNDQPPYKQSQASAGIFIVRWLPDASGFLFSTQTLMRDSANIFRYDFATRKVTQVTHLENEFTGSFTISPDGQWIVFERSKSLDDNRDIDLWIARINGGNARLLVRNGFSPSWR